MSQLKNRYFKTRLVKKGPLIPVKLWWGVSKDPVTGEAMDRSPRPYLRVGSIDLPARIGKRDYDWAFERGVPVIFWSIDDGEQSGGFAPHGCSKLEYDALLKAQGYGSAPMRSVDINATRPVV